MSCKLVHSIDITKTDRFATNKKSTNKKFANYVYSQIMASVVLFIQQIDQYINYVSD